MWDNTIFNLQFSVQLPSIVVTVKWTGAMDVVQLGSEQVTREGDLVSTDGPLKVRMTFCKSCGHTWERLLIRSSRIFVYYS